MSERETGFFNRKKLEIFSWRADSVDFNADSAFDFDVDGVACILSAVPVEVLLDPLATVSGSSTFCSTTSSLSFNFTVGCFVLR
jgi:hypothetical protein